MAEESGKEVAAKEMRVTDAFASGDISAEAYKMKMAALRAERSSLRQCVEGLTIQPSALRNRVAQTIQLATSLFDIYQNFNDVRRAELLRTVFASIVLASNGTIGFTLRSSFERLQRAQTAAHVDRPEAIATALLDAACS